MGHLMPAKFAAFARRLSSWPISRHVFPSPFFSPRSPFYFAILLCVFAVDLGAILFLFSLFILFARSRTSDILESRMRN